MHELIIKCMKYDSIISCGGLYKFAFVDYQKVLDFFGNSEGKVISNARITR